MKYIDIHCHLDSSDFDADREEILARMKESRVGTITIGADFQSSKKAVKIAEMNENIWATIGIHPEHISDFSSSEQEREWMGLEELVKSPKVVGIGECGLDYFRLDPASAKATTDKQKRLFESHIQFATKHNKPLMLHIREAYDDALNILQNYKKADGPEAERLRGNVHFFAGNVEIAKKFLDLGFTFSFTGVVTFTKDYDEVIKYIPRDSIMSETDAPWVAPVPFRGKRNEPTYVVEVIKKLAEIRRENVDELNGAIITNAKRLFGLSC